MQFGERCLFALAINGLLAVGVLVGTAAAQTTSSTSEADRRAALLAMGTGKEPMAAEDYAKLPVSPLTRAYIPDAVDLSSRFPPPWKRSSESC